MRHLFLITILGNTRSFRVAIIHDENYLEEWLASGLDVWYLGETDLEHTHLLQIRSGYKLFEFGFYECDEFVEDLQNDGIMVWTSELVVYCGGDE